MARICLNNVKCFERENSMTIVFVIDHLGNGGAERVVSVLANNMIVLGHEVYLVVVKDERNYALDEKIHYIVAESSHQGKLARRVDRVKALTEIIRGIQPDVVFSFGYYMNLYTVMACRKIKGCKLIISERTDPATEPAGIIKQKIRNLIYLKADLLVCQTEQAKKYFSNRQQNKCTVIPNPIISVLPDPHNGERRKTIVTACRLEKQKNLPLLIRAFSSVHEKHPEYKLVIYGDGSLRSELEQLVASKNLKEFVLFPGFKKDIHEEILDASMYVSSSDYEGISNSMLEAMGMGLPIICTDCPVGGAALAIEDHVNGILVPVGDEGSLTDAMLFYIENQETAEQYGKMAMSIKQRFNVDTISQKWIDLI